MTVTRVKKGLVKGVVTAAFALTIAASLQGCPLLLIGGVAAGAGGAAMATDRRTVGTQMDDREIQIRAAAQLAGDLPKAAHVDVAVFNRRVLIVGEVPDPDSKELATKIVRNVADVESIVNELAVQPANLMSGRSRDTFITSKVKSSIIAEKNISANDFKVVTERGNVYLMGLVTRDEGSRAADIASRVPGVVKVVKAYQYILADDQPTKKPFMSTTPEDSPDSTSATPGENMSPAGSAASPGADAGVTTGAVPADGVSAQPLDQQAPAPIGNAGSAQPGNPTAKHSSN